MADCGGRLVSGLYVVYTLYAVDMNLYYCRRYIDVRINFTLSVQYIVLSIICVFQTCTFEENIMLFLFWLLQWIKYTRKEVCERMFPQKPLFYL